MLLPDDFQFSQNNLQDYIDCARRFQLLHLLHQEWPALQTEFSKQSDRLIELGQNFHRLVFQFFSGVSMEMISEGTKNPGLEILWQNFLKSDVAQIIETIKAEFTLSVPFCGFRLTAKYDLIVFKAPSKIIIYDWKTSSKQPKRERMLQRMQSKIYPLVLSLSGYPLENPISANNIEMIYWYPHHPSSPISFVYTSKQETEDLEFLESLVKEILEFREPIFPLTIDLKKCKFCTYRSLCNRGDKAGSLDEMIDQDDLQTESVWDLDFENIEEINF
jgi:CRISPR/Cas system-associated exonuclease Cas4 (RecB family)